MTKNQFLDILSIDNKLVNKRCTTEFLSKNGLLNELNKFVDESFGTVSERIKFVKYGGGYCQTCNTRTKVDVSGQGFAKYCKEHFHDAKKGKVATNRKEIDIEKAISLYNAGSSISTIANQIGISNVALKSKLVAADVQFRSHSENQKLNSYNKGKSTFLFDESWWRSQYPEKSSETIAKELGCSPTLVLNRLAQYGIDRTFVRDTRPESIIEDLLKSLNVTYQKKVTGILPNNYELDFLIGNVAIEVNGLFWHSEANNKTKAYHLTKTELCESKGIQLLHFWDTEILDQQDAVENIIKAKLNKNQKVFARKCTVRYIEDSDTKDLLKYHMQGYTPAAMRIGLYYDGELVCLGTFSKPRFAKQYDWELIRFVSKPNITVVGGLSKILSQVSGTIISYANRRWSIGGAYDRCGFSMTHVTQPNYYYTKDFKSVHSRYKFQKHKIQHLPMFDPILPEHEIMKNNGYWRVWDCGQLVYVKKA